MEGSEKIVPRICEDCVQIKMENLKLKKKKVRPQTKYIKNKYTIPVSFGMGREGAALLPTKDMGAETNCVFSVHLKGRVN